jgi:hypothetical protein
MRRFRALTAADVFEAHHDRCIAIPFVESWGLIVAIIVLVYAWVAR